MNYDINLSYDAMKDHKPANEQLEIENDSVLSSGKRRIFVSVLISLCVV